MPQDNRNLVETLKSELDFLNKGGYGRSPRTPWKPQLIFEDSPTCMNYDSKEDPRPCSECLLMQFVPAEFRGEKVPCRHIALNAEGQSIDSFYQYGTQSELEDSLRYWLEQTISRLEKQSSETPVCTNRCGGCETKH
jgi:hypothetical protein